MLGMSYISVPLYQMFCQTYGLGGSQNPNGDKSLLSLQSGSNEYKSTGKQGQGMGKEEEEKDWKAITIKFSVDTSKELGWRLTPSISKMKIYPGDPALTFYTAENLRNEPVTGVATYNIMPSKAGVYFNKIQCFCFEEQRLKGGEKVELPILFYLDSDFRKDPKMKDIDSITLSYTFYVPN